MNFDDITEDDMRAHVVERLKLDTDNWLRQATSDEELLSDTRRRVAWRRQDEAHARYSRRQAAHFQQAIDLLTAAPMPKRDDHGERLRRSPPKDPE
jgi:hypothetical protein